MRRVLQINADQIFYLNLEAYEEEAVSMILNGFCKDVFKELPEFCQAVAAEMKLEGSVG